MIQGYQIKDNIGYNTMVINNMTTYYEKEAYILNA